jgi:acetyl esterase/lipase
MENKMQTKPTAEKVIIAFCAALLFAANNVFPQSDVIKIWPGLAPGTENRKDQEKVQDGNITHVYQPDITIMLPAKRNQKIPAVVIFPGGGYRNIVVDKEGYEIAKWLNNNGIAAFILKYRLDTAEALQDAQRALSLIRSKSDEYGIDPQKIGVIGFSAGGHLAANISTHYKKETMTDHIDSVSCKPDFEILVYAYSSPLVNDIDENTPPTFLAHAGDDSKVPVMQSVDFYAALEKHKVPAELHIYEKGEHGFALREIDKPVNNWAKSCIDWMRVNRILPAK